MINYIRENKYCGCYSSFEGSPMSQGKFQFDLWNASPNIIACVGATAPTLFL